VEKPKKKRQKRDSRLQFSGVHTQFVLKHLRAESNKKNSYAAGRYQNTYKRFPVVDDSVNNH
jgi:hypothetical protein